MGLNSMNTKIYAFHEYFHGLMVGQRTPGFFGCHNNNPSKNKHLSGGDTSPTKDKLL